MKVIDVVFILAMGGAIIGITYIYKLLNDSPTPATYNECVIKNMKHQPTIVSEVVHRHCAAIHGMPIVRK